jgi:hypothetical protein
MVSAEPGTVVCRLTCGDVVIELGFSPRERAGRTAASALWGFKSVNIGTDPIRKERVDGCGVCPATLTS